MATSNPEMEAVPPQQQHEKEDKEKEAKEKEKEKEKEAKVPVVVAAAGGTVGGGGATSEEEDEEVIEQTKDMTEGIVIRQAYLLKRTHAIKHSWHKRWFVLRKERLNIYNDDKEYELLRFIKLKEAKLLERTTRHREHTFAILEEGMKTLYLQAPSEEERTAWIEALITAGITPTRDHPNDLLLSTHSPENGSNGSLNTPLTPGKKSLHLEDDKSPKGKIKAESPRVYFSDDNDNENTSESEGELTNPLEKVMAEGVIKQGYLLKQTVVRKKWKKRWVVLRENGKLMYYKNDQEYEVLKVIKITHGLEIAPTPLEKHKRPFGFQFTTPKRTFYFVASSEEDCKSWIDTLNTEKAKLASTSHDDEEGPARKHSAEFLVTPVSATTPVVHQNP